MQPNHAQTQGSGSLGSSSSGSSSSSSSTTLGNSRLQSAAAAPHTAAVIKPPASRVPGSCSVVAGSATAAGSSCVRQAMSGGAAPISQPGTATPAAAVPDSSWLAGTSALPETALSQHQQHSSISSSSGHHSRSAAASMPQQAPAVQKPLPPAAAFAQVAEPGLADYEQQQQQRLQGARLAGLGPLKSSAVAAASSIAATVGPAALSSRIRPSAALEQQLQKELVLEDLDDEEADVPSAPAAIGSSSSAPFPSNLFGSSSSSSSSTTSSSRFSGGSGSSSSLAGLQQLLPDQQRQLSKVLWGDEVAKPDAAWQQGLVFCDTPGLEWGLVQLAGGPCGVLAAVQAHLIATLMEQGLWGLLLRPEQLQEALASSLTTLLWAARSSSSSSSSAAKVVMLPLATSSAAARGMCDAAQAARMAQVATADSRQQLEVLVRAALPQWCQRKGWGLLLLLYSLLLTRGCSCVAADMDEAGLPLVDGLGYCSMELVNLMLTGAACSNVFDGRREFGADDSSASTGAAAGDDQQQAGAAAEGGHVLMGVTSQARVGLLTLFEWYRYVEVGQNLKSPRFPVWVVCSESHFSTLALAAPQQQQQHHAAGSKGYIGLSSSLQPAPGSALVLEYYDGMARQEEPIRLELLPAPGGVGWSSRMAGVADERGCWQGRPIPPLECVVETKWRDVAVAWHGSDPIL
uniref:Deubiquitinating enzyme MINDY-3/4 conserved domain-containing protein n=1 Tax=Tetradesmus obliquus TaxID=3088 RepID=A0A383VRI7_TETOB|eukprot:jgi/Sobl393_1/6141/SZX67523.1